MKVAGLQLDRQELRQLQGDHWIGWNATGVTYSTMHISEEEMILREEMPGEIIDDIMTEVANFADAVKNRNRKGGELIGKIPTPMFFAWKKQWERTSKQSGVLFNAFLMSKLLDSDYSRFRIKKPKLYVGAT